MKQKKISGMTYELAPKPVYKTSRVKKTKR
jgi:hypothetical protein